MPYTRNSTLNGTTRVTAGQATSYARSRGARGDYETYIYFLWTWANGRRLNPLVLFGQWCDETATGTSTRWLRGDPAGIGIFADDTPSTLKPNLTGVESAAVHIVELATKAYGVDEPAKIGNVNVLAIDPHLKRVWSFVGRAGWPYPKTLHDLRAPVPGSPGDYVWAANQAYGEQIAAHINRVLSFAGIDEDGMTVSKPSGLTPWPAIVDRPLPDKFGSGMSYQYRKPFVASWWHSMVGWLWSTDAYFRMPSVRAATDYGIGGEGDGASDGVIFRWINYQQREYATPWASGWDTAPHFDDQGAEFFKKFGVRGVNQGGISVEFSGLVATPVSAKQWAAGIHLTAAIHHRDLGQGYEEFAWNMHHREVAEKDCPFPRIYRYTPEYQAAIIQIMRHFETGADIPDFVTIAGKKVALPHGDADGPIVKPAPPIFVPFTTSQVFHTRTDVPSRQWSSTDAEVVRRYPAHTAIRCTGYYLGETWKDDPRWLTVKSTGPSNNARIHASHVIEKFTDGGILKDGRIALT